MALMADGFNTFAHRSYPQRRGLWVIFLVARLPVLLSFPLVNFCFCFIWSFLACTTLRQTHRRVFCRLHRGRAFSPFSVPPLKFHGTDLELVFSTLST